MDCNKKLDFSTMFLIIALCAGGLFHEFLTAFAGLVLIIYLATLAYKNKTLKLYLNISLVAIVAITAGYLMSIFYAIDKGAAVIGFFKFLPLLLFLLVAMQLKKTADDYLKVVPTIACMMTIISTVLMQIPALTDWFSVSGRLAGFFQYSNTFALFLLVAFIITATKENLEKLDYLYIAVFVFGILYSGSRTVFVLGIVSLVAIVIFGKSRKNKIVFLSASVLITVIAVVYAVVTDNFDTIGRFMTVSLTESTFVGRFLYYVDALPIIFKHPFGLGYLGYFYMHPSFQTGVYTVKFVHNEFLQIILDIGFVPMLIFVAAIIKSFFKKGAGLRKRMLLSVITAHCCFDFDLQFVAFFMLFILLLDYKDGKEKQLHISSVPMGLGAAVLSVLLLYIGFSQMFVYFKEYDVAAKMFPWDTFAQVKILETADVSDETENLADRITDQNEYIATAYNKKAQIAYSKGDFEKVIEYKNKATSVTSFSYETQEEYCYMLINGIYLYSKNNDIKSAKICYDELIKTVKYVQRSDDRLSKLGKMIDDQPIKNLPEDITEYVRRVSDDVS